MLSVGTLSIALSGYGLSNNTNTHKSLPTSVTVLLSVVTQTNTHSSLPTRMTVFLSMGRLVCVFVCVRKRERESERERGRERVCV